MRLRHRLRNQRGSILLFTTVLVVPLMIIIAGLAIDLAYYGTVDDEIQRSMDAAALAGAGKLGFDSSAFAGARQAAQDYATSNPYRAEKHAKQIITSTFTQNSGNADPNGNVILGIWNGVTRTFTPSLDGTLVNAVKCQYASSIPTSFLKLIGLNSLSTAAQATAISSPPATCGGCCLFPIGVTKCGFQASGNFGSQGCGQPVSTFTAATGDTAAWINTTGMGTPSAPATKDAITAAATGGICASTLRSGGQVGATNGMQESVFSSLADCNGNNCKDGPGTQGYFINKFNSPTINTVHDSSNNITYQGHGWEVFVAVIDSSCPPGPINGDHQILTFSRLVITQVIDHGYCSVQNPYLRDTTGNLWDPKCPSPNGTGTRDPNLNAIFGYYSCAPIDAPSTPIPAPRAALSTKLKLVQ
jgi:Flp pilus assembly protein TadG